MQAMRDTVHDTLRVMIHDTTVVHDTTAVHDTLTQFMGRVPSMLDVRIHDPLGWKDLIAFAVQVVVPLGAALLGAWWGGKSATEAASTAISKEWKLERDDAIRRLKLRAASNLRRIELLAEKYVAHDTKLAVGTEVGEELEVVWNLYYRVAEPIFTLGVSDLSERLDAYFVRTHILAEEIKAFERKAREIEMEDIRDGGRSGHIRETRSKLPGERQAVLNKLQDLAKEASDLLKEVRALDLPA